MIIHPMSDVPNQVNWQNGSSGRMPSLNPAWYAPENAGLTGFKMKEDIAGPDSFR
jgi:hypothetical protein